MPIVYDLPDISHWKTVQEFTIEQAALLLAGIDPLDCKEGLITAQNSNLNRWKLAWGFSEGLVSAIRRGVLTPVVCMSETLKWNDWDKESYIEYENMKPTDRNSEISKRKTIITRDSLFVWVEDERVDFVRNPAPQKIKKDITPSNFEAIESVVEVLPNSSNKGMQLLPKYEHQSEGLEFVQDAIKELWSTYDEDNPQTAPTKKEVIDYLTERGAGKNMAEAVNLVLRPASLQGIGRRLRKSTL